MNDSSRATSTRSPVLAILGSLVAGAVLAVTFVFTVASGGSEPLVTGSVLFAFGLGWGLMGFLSTRFSAQPQAWTAVPAAVLGSVGLGLMVFQPGPALMDFLSWSGRWPSPVWRSGWSSRFEPISAAGVAGSSPRSSPPSSSSRSGAA